MLSKYQVWIKKNFLQLVILFLFTLLGWIKCCQPLSVRADLVPGPVRVTGLDLLDQLCPKHPVSACFTWRKGALLSSCECNHCTLSLPIFRVTGSSFLLKNRKCKVHTNQIANNPSKWLMIQMKKPNGLLIRRRNQINKYVITWWQGGEWNEWKGPEGL